MKNRASTSRGRKGQAALAEHEKFAARELHDAGVLEQFRLFDLSQDAIFLWRSPGGIEFWNRGASELYGYSPEEALGRASHELLKTKFPEPREEIETRLSSSGSWQGELRHRTRDGRELVVWSRFHLVPHSGEGMLVLESTRDITDAKRNQDRLQRRMREQAVAAQFSLDALRATNTQVICDDATHILGREMEVTFSSLYEVAPDGKTMFMRAGSGWPPGIVGSAKIEAGEETVAGRALQLNQPIVIEDVTSDRQLRLPAFLREHSVSSSVAVVIQGRERAFGVLSAETTAARRFSAEDVHFLESIGNILATAISRIQFESDLRDTAGRLRGIVDTAVDGIITIDERGVVETMNPAAERIFGFAANEVVGRNVSMLMPEPYRSEHDGYLERYRRTGERRIIGIGREVKGRRKDGTQFPMDLAVSATNLNDRRIFTGLVRDISERKQLEQEILEISDHEQRRIGSDLHDDLCQRLAGIRFACDALRKSIGHGSGNNVLERLEKIGENVSDAIDRTRLLARGLAPVALETNGLAAALEELVTSICKIFAVQCVFHSDGEVGVKDPIAATHLYRIAQEAINNALKHAHASQMVVSLERADRKALLTITDDGSGFDSQEAQRAGQGMGLRTIAYRAGLISANVEVISAAGRGTKLICTFPSDL